MNHIRFQHGHRKKTFLFPLLVVVLVYILIPSFLISKGKNAIQQSIENLKNDTFMVPDARLHNGLVFLNTAESFPGFSAWANGIEKKAKHDLIEMHKQKFISSVKAHLLKGNSSVSDSIIHIDLKLSNDSNLLIIKRKGKNDELLFLDKNEELLLDSLYCTPWLKVFNNLKLDKSQIHPYIKQFTNK